VTELVVHLCGRRAGRLIRKDNGNLQFRYDAGYDGPPLSLTLPIRAEAHPHAACLAVFGGLLLEGDARSALARSLGLSAANDFGLLEELGGDCAGAISLLPEGIEPRVSGERRVVDEAALDALLLDLPQRPLAADPEHGIRLSLAGAQPKVPLIRDNDGTLALPLDSESPTTHILKPELDRFPGLVDNEAFCMALARACELPVASVRKRRSVTGLAYLEVERYDRDLTSDPIRRLHQEDFCQALGVPSDRKYQAEGGPGVRDCVTAIRAATGVPAQELPRFLRAVVFNWLIGNCDAHAKNFSLLYDGGAPTLAPLYDLVSTVVYPRLTTRLAMSVGSATRLEQVGGRAWLALADDIGVRPAFVTRIRDEIAERVAAALPDLLATAEHDNEAARAVAARVTSLIR